VWNSGKNWPEINRADEEALLRAFPLIEERIDGDTQGWNDPPDIGTPYDTWRDTRTTIHMLMRLAFQQGEDWLVEILEHQREMNAAQTAFALAHLRRRVESPGPDFVAFRPE